MSIDVQKINVNYGTKRILQDVSFRISQGERVAILGPNGCGKSTLLRSISQICKLKSGVVNIDGKELNAYSRKDLAKKLGFLSQISGMPPMLTVRDHVALGRHPYRKYLLRDRSEDHDAISLALSRCQIQNLANRSVENLSGGERQRVRVATLLAQQPLYYLLDEPMAGLDIEHQYELLDLISRLSSQQGMSFLVVLHDISMALTHFDRAIVLSEGKVFAEGPPSEVVTSEMIKSVFNIEANVVHDMKYGHSFVVYGEVSSGYNVNL